MRKPRTRAVCVPVAIPELAQGPEIASPVNFPQESGTESSTRQSQACSTPESGIPSGDTHYISFFPIAPDYKYTLLKIRDHSQEETLWFIPVEAVGASLVESLLKKHDAMKAETREI